MAEDLMVMITERKRTKKPIDEIERNLFRVVRVWYGIFNLEHMYGAESLLISLGMR